jgi:UDP-N-acetylmuramate--alanine ligase
MITLKPEPVNTLLQAAPGALVYLIGAGGCGMSALGHLLLDLGHAVAGSDLADNFEIQQLRARGALIHTGHAATQLEMARPVLVVYSPAVRLDNAEMAAARQLQIPIVRRAVLLAALVGRQLGICVAGMHGKTTTTALLAFALEQLGAAPSFAVGAAVPQLERHARYSPGPQAWFVAEADESDGTLREFTPEHAIILNVDEEHLDFYANLDAICQEFDRFASQSRGRIFFCADDPRLAELYARQPRAISFGFHPLAQYRAVMLAPVPGSRSGAQFEVWRGGVLLDRFRLGLVGEKNVSNATAVIALLAEIGVAVDAIARAIEPFQGAARRQQELFADSRFCVMDDYGHHPNEIRATLRALKGLGYRRLLVAFQPHRYSRTQHLLADFATSFADADRLWLAEIYAASEPAIPGVTSAALAAEIRATGQSVELAPSLDELPALVRGAMEPGDLVVFLGAGDITRAAHQLAAQLEEEPVMHKERLLADLAAVVSSKTVLRGHEPLARRTTLRVGGKADFYVEPASEADLSELLKFATAHKLPFLILGRGSNLLIRDGGIRGLVICLGQPAFSRLEIIGERLHCGAGLKLKQLAVTARKQGLTGLEFLEGIPGSVGGALRMNAGAMGSWMFEVVESIRFMDYSGVIHERQASEVNVEYRGCPLFKQHIALGAVLKAQPASPAAIEARMKAFNEKRWTSQPAAPSAGCIFKNPETIPAGRLIDELGLKGTRVGGAVVSDIHGNFIVNDGHATARDVLNLIEIIKLRARMARGIELHTEVEIIGEESDIESKA